MYLKDSHLETDFDGTHGAGLKQYADGDDITIVKLGTIALFKKHKLTSRMEKIEEIAKAHNICLTYKVLSSGNDCDDLSSGLHGKITTREKK